MNPKISDALTAARNKATGGFAFPDAQSKTAFDHGFQAGFTAGLDYHQKQIDAYKAYMAGKITLSELERITQ